MRHFSRQPLFLYYLEIVKFSLNTFYEYILIFFYEYHILYTYIYISYKLNIATVNDRKAHSLAQVIFFSEIRNIQIVIDCSF